MLKFHISPEYCLIVNAFNKTTSLREASKVLGMEPSALVRKVQILSRDFNFLDKVGNRWTVTPQGQKIAQWTDEILISQQKLLDEKPQLRISAFSWLVEEMMAQDFESFANNLPDYSWHFNMTASKLENELISGRTDFVITGHAPNEPTIAHKKLNSFAWLAVAPASWQNEIRILKGKSLTEFLDEKPFIRNSQMNPEQILNFTPKNQSTLTLDGIIGIRAAVNAGLGWSAIPLMAAQTLLKQETIINLKLQTHVNDHLSIWWLRSRKQTASLSKYLAEWIKTFELVF